MKQWKRLWTLVDAQLATPEADMALAHAARLARETPCCLLCLEADPTVCHRAHVADALVRRHGFTVVHLRVEGDSMV